MTTNKDPNIVILVYRLGNEIVKVKDHYEKLESKVAELEKQGIEGVLYPLAQEHMINAIIARSSAKRHLLN